MITFRTQRGYSKQWGWHWLIIKDGKNVGLMLEENGSQGTLELDS